MLEEDESTLTRGLLFGGSTSDEFLVGGNTDGSIAAGAKAELVGTPRDDPDSTKPGRLALSPKPKTPAAVSIVGLAGGIPPNDLERTRRLAAANLETPAADSTDEGASTDDLALSADVGLLVAVSS